MLIAFDLEAILTEAGAEVVGPATTVGQALMLASSEPLSAALLDITLGRVTINPVARLLAEFGVPFVFYTGQDDGRAVVAEWPDSPIILKPAMPHMIVGALALALYSTTSPDSRCADQG